MNQIYDLIIVGAGPAGLAAALLCKKHSISYLVIESGTDVFSGIASSYPEAKLVYPSKPKDATEPFMVEDLRPPDKPVPVESYLQYIHHLAQHEQLNVQTSTTLEEIKNEKDYLLTITDKSTYRSKKVLLAFGSNIPRELSVYGDAKMVAKNVDDPMKYVGKKTMVIGGGNSAADIIITILKAKREANDKQPVYWAHQSEKFDVNTETAQRLGEEILLGGNIRLLPGAMPRIGEVDENGVDRLVLRVNEFKQDDGIDMYHGMSFPMENIIACIGSQGPSAIFDKLGIQTIACASGVCKIAKDGERLALLTATFESSRKGIYIIGGAISPSYMKINEDAITEQKHPNLIYTAINDANSFVNGILSEFARS